MRRSLFLAIAGTTVLAMMLLLLLAGASVGQTDPPASGDWTVSDTTLVQDQTVDLNGDLTVTSTGRLTLKNVKLRIQLNADGQHGIEVQNGGELYIIDGDGDSSTTADASRVTAVPTSFGYYFINRAGSTLRISDSFIENCGHTGSTGQTRWGVYVATDDAVISGTTIASGSYGLVLEGGTITVTDSSINNNTYHGITTTDADLTVSGTTLADNGYDGVRIVRGDAVIDGCNIITNRDGVVVRTGANVTIANSLIKGNTEGLLQQIDANVIVRNCTFRGQTRYGVHVTDRGNLDISDSLITGSTRSGLFANNLVIITSTGSTYANNVYGVRLNMLCDMTSEGDTFRGNTNSGVYLETTSDLLIISGTVKSNSGGIKGEGGSTIEAWSTTVKDCFFEGYSLTNTDLVLHDGEISNCTGGGVVPDADSSASWTVHTGNSSVLSDADSTLTGGMAIHGDTVLSGSTIIFKDYSDLTSDGGAQDWQNVTIRPFDSSSVVGFEIKGTASGSAWFLTLESAGSISMPTQNPMVSVPFEFHRSTFTDSGNGIIVSADDVVFDRCTFTSNNRGVSVVDHITRFENCSFSANNIDVRVDHAKAILVNSSFDPTRISQGLGGAWSAWWVVHIDVKFPSGHAAPGAQVEVRDVKDNLVFLGTTNANGHISEVLLLEHVTDEDVPDDRTPHTFNATSGASQNETIVDVDSHVTVTILLKDSDAPVLVVTSHNDGDHIANPTLVLRGTATDGGSSVFRVEARISTQAWSQATGTDSWEVTFNLPGDGTYPLTVRARDYALNVAIVYLNLTLDTRAPQLVLLVPPTPANNSLVGSNSGHGWDELHPQPDPGRRYERLLDHGRGHGRELGYH
jgi:hypothetical protein